MDLPALAREKVVWLLIDGIGDISLTMFGDRTPLEVAHVPWLDSIAGLVPAPYAFF
jgi:2,3-bisphosphoglycerate-independent phosphoglycerate mutase